MLVKGVYLEQTTLFDFEVTLFETTPEVKKCNDASAYGFGILGRSKFFENVVKPL